MAKSLQELFVEELRDIYDGEKRLVRALPKMAKAAESSRLQMAFATHARETERQVARLEQVFRALGQPARGKKCDGIMGLLEEANSHIEELEGSLLDVALLAGAQKVEHYEIAAYGTLAYLAEMLGQDRAKTLLGQTLEEEKATDEKLSALAKSDVNRTALMNAGNEEESAGRTTRRRTPSRARAASSRRGARSARGTSRRRTASRKATKRSARARAR